MIEALLDPKLWAVKASCCAFYKPRDLKEPRSYSAPVVLVLSFSFPTKAAIYQVGQNESADSGFIQTGKNKTSVTLECDHGYSR